MTFASPVVARPIAIAPLAPPKPVFNAAQLKSLVTGKKAVPLTAEFVSTLAGAFSTNGQKVLGFYKVENPTLPTQYLRSHRYENGAIGLVPDLPTEAELRMGPQRGHLLVQSRKTDNVFEASIFSADGESQKFGLYGRGSPGNEKTQSVRVTLETPRKGRERVVITALNRYSDGIGDADTGPVRLAVEYDKKTGRLENVGVDELGRLLRFY